MPTKTTRSSEAEVGARVPRMCGDRLLVRQDKSEFAEGKVLKLEKTLEESRPDTGVVLAISLGIKAHNADRDKTVISVGDHIYFAAYASSTRIEVNGESLVVLSVYDVIAVEDRKD